MQKFEALGSNEWDAYKRMNTKNLKKFGRVSEWQKLGRENDLNYLKMHK